MISLAPASGLELELKVCPALSDKQFLLTIEQLSNSLVRGCASSLFLDRGENFVQSRAYQQGDAMSSIDWKASARSKSLIVKEHESMRQTVVSLVVDRSGSMTAGSPAESKYVSACILCGGLAYAALKIGSPVAILLSDAETHPAATLSSSRISAQIMAMRRFRFRQRTPLSRCIGEGFLRTKHRQMIFVLSDFHDACALDRIAPLAERHEVVLIRFRDAIEVRTPSVGVIHLLPAEGDRARYARHQTPQQGTVDEAFAALGLPTVLIDPAQPVSRQLVNFLSLQKAIF